MEVKKICDKIKKYNVISFDIFDTLIIRMVNNPKQIFNIVEKLYNSENDKKIQNYKTTRIKCEKLIQGEYPSLLDIYKRMNAYYTEDECRKLMDLEIKTEKKYCIANDDIKKIYEYCIKLNKKIYAVSDMYLSSETLREILYENGYNIDNIIVSNEKKATKSSSKLFKYINEDKNEIIHIGDSLKADFIGARKLGIKSVMIKKKHFECNNDNLEVLNKLKNTDDYFYNIGYSILGPTLYSFSIWLEEQFEENKINNIYFLAREGKIFKEIFDIIENKNTKYIYVSRKAINMANFGNIKFKNLKEILEYFTIKKDSTLRETLNYLNLNLDIGRYEFDENVYKLIKNDELFNKINVELTKKSNEANSIFKRYLAQENVKGKFAIVDIGWNGTMQKNLKTFLEYNSIDYEMFGFYFSLFRPLDNGKAFISETTDSNTKLYKAINDNPVLIENVFQCIDGSTIGYRLDIEKNTIIPKKKNIEFDSFTIKAINEIDLGIVDFINKWKEYGFCENFEMFRNKNLNELRKFITKPTLKDVAKFKKFVYSDIKEKSSIISKDKNFIKGLYSSGWKYGYMKSKIIIPINYQLIIEILKKIKTRKNKYKDE